MIQPGSRGIDGFCRFLEYFVQRGLEGGMVELKVEQLLEALNSVRGKSGNLAPNPSSQDPTGFDITSQQEQDEINPISPAIPETVTSESQKCDGFIFPFGSNYPWGLHEKVTFPWSVKLDAGVITLRSHACTGQQGSGSTMCTSCSSLSDEGSVEGILYRAEHGTPVNTSYAYYSFNGLTELIRRKNQQLQELRLKGLNNARKLLVQARSLSDHKRLVRAIASGVVQNVERVIRVVLRQNRGIRGVLRLHDDAARGVYHPKDYTEEDDLRGVLNWKMGGNRLADFAHRALGLPSRTTLRNRLTVPPITPSPGTPQASEVAQNVEACFAGLKDALSTRKVVHAVLMFDELATEKRIRWDDKTNNFLGVCRQHGSKVSLQFNNERDLEELFRALESKNPDDAVHYAAEATVAAIGVLDRDTRLYAARPVLVSGDCKKESGAEHARNVILPTLDGVNSKKDATNLRIVSIESDGESRRGSAFIDLTFIRKLSAESPIYEYLKDLPLMDFHVGDDDLTAGKDPKHVFKRGRNRFLRKSGTQVMGVHISPAIIRTHLQSANHSYQHISSILNPKDKQDVKLAFNLLSDIWSLPLAFENNRPGFISARIALHTTGTLFWHLLFPYICVDLSLSEQLEHLSAAAHLALNVYFCVAKAKADDPEGNFWLILLGTDRLEQLFGILRTMIGNDSNLDMLQLVERITGTTECANIFAKYPHWDRPPRRLSLPALTRDSTELPEKVDHIRPPSWRGNTAVRDVTLLTCWKRGRRILEEELPHLLPDLRTLDNDAAANPDINILSPHGTLITKVTIDDDDNEDDDEPDGEAQSTAQSLAIDVEDAVVEEEDRQHRHTAISTDRLRRVAAIERFSSTGNSDITEFDSAFGAPTILISEPIVTLVRSDDKLFVCVGEVTDIFVDSQSVEQITVDDLLEKATTISFQILRANLSAPGRLVLPIDPPLSMRIPNTPRYLFESSVLRAFGARLMDLNTPSSNKLIPKFAPTESFPYRESQGLACFLCERDDESALSVSDPHPQSVMAHVGAHILYDPKIDRSLEPCGLCGRPAPLCSLFLKKSSSGSGALTVDMKSSHGCPNLVKRFSIAAASKSIVSSPCSNAPLICPACTKKEPAVWRYNMRAHLIRHHPDVPLSKHAHLWELSDGEKKGMEAAVRKYKPTLSISAAHSSRLALTNNETSTDIQNDTVESSGSDSSECNSPVSGPQEQEDIELPDIEPQEDDFPASLTVPRESLPLANTPNPKYSPDETVDAAGIDSSNAIPRTIVSPPAQDPEAASSVGASSASANEASNPVTTRFGRKRTLRAVGNLELCICGESAKPAEGESILDVAQCRKEGCETKWVRTVSYRV
ncbi:hypothetical protein R3P38DRAFT_3326830 [Favolaschia claudopus]|uniref:Uncharacterized protein n=1 Tax=Favolaschia claudopus TaxID=2862362 RepID=A0AAW0A746_9AGAR